MTDAPDSLFITGPNFEQEDPQTILVTPQGRPQTTLAQALADASGTVSEVVINAPEFLTSGTITSLGSITSAVSLTNRGLVLGGGPGQPIRATGTLGNAQLLVGQSGDPAARSVSGDVTMDNTGAFGLVASGVTAGAYGDSTHTGQFTVDSRGRLLAAASVAITAGSGGSVTSVVAGAGLAGGTITNSGTVSLGTIAAGDLLGNSGSVAAVPTGVAIGANLTLSAGTLSASGGGGGVTLSAHSILGNDGTVSAAGTSVAIGTNLTLVSGTLSASSGSGPILQSSVSLSSTDILNLATTPITVAPAPGSGSFVRFLAASMTFRNVTSAYTGGTGMALFFNNKSGLVSSSTFPSAFQLAQTRSVTNISNTVATVTPSQVDNLALVLATPTAFAGGDGTALLTVDYAVFPSQ